MANSENENMGEDVIKEVVGMFEDLDEPTRAQALQQLSDKYCLDCGSDLPADPDEDCPCQDEDDGEDDDDGDEDDADEDEDEDEGDEPSE